jgi:hypothetical protein
MGVPVSEAPNKSKYAIQLTSEEESQLLWETGDYFEIVPGTINFSSKRKYQMVPAQANPWYTQLGFFFDSSSSWGSREWHISAEGEVPNGPALLILYKRGTTADAYGIVSMVNRSWIHIWPLASAPLLKSSSKFKELSRLETGTLVKGFLGALGGGMLTGGLLAGAGAKAAMKGSATKQKEGFETITGTLRAFMHRIASNPDQYWNGGDSSSTSGKL